MGTPISVLEEDAAELIDESEIEIEIEEEPENDG